MEDKMKDIEYEAVRFNSKIDFKIIRELFSKSFIKSHRDITLEGIGSILSSPRKDELSDRSFTLLKDALMQEERIKEAEAEYIDSMNRNGLYTVAFEDKDYPFIWRYLDGMPRVFFCKGKREMLTKLHRNGAAAIVGSRDAGSYSLYATSDMVSKLTAHDVVIVSGMAMGIDRQAHLKALELGKDTIAVLPGGADMVYPKQNADIYERIASEGLLISEMPPGGKVLKQYFPARNRLISGISDACLVMEAGIYSGTLHTASFAASQGKDVFVLPNNIYSENSLGGHLLIRDGARILIDADEVIKAVREEVAHRNDGMRVQDKTLDREEIQRKMNEDPSDLTDEELSLVITDQLRIRARNADELSVMIPVPFPMLLAKLSDMEMKGEVVTRRGKYEIAVNR